MEKTPINYCKFIDSSYDDKYSVNEYNDNNSITEENTRTQKPPKYSCQPCDYKCNKKNEWGRHISTLKHINRTQNIIDNQFECKLCEFSCKKESEWSRHVQTKKHKTRSNKIETSLSITCDICNKEYKSKTSLWYHKKTCIPLLENTIIKETIQDENIKKNDDDAATLNTNNLVIELLKQNNELQKQIIEMAKEPKIVNYNNTNNQCTNNNQFNLNMFLNETCKDALNIDDFMNSLELTVEDLEQTGKLGFVQGITRIFLKGLRDLDVTQRPFHCTDTKRETVYVKDQDKWEKESDKKTKMKQALNQAVRKNLKLISLWREEHPDYLKSNTQDNDDYIKISLNSLGSEYEDEQQRMDEKIIRNVLREVILDKKIVIKDS